MLLEAAQCSDRNRREELAEELNVRLRLVIQYKCRGWSPEDKEDILQETMEVFWGKLQSIKDRPQSYALRILRNKIGDQLRKRAGRRDITAADADPLPPPRVPLDEKTLIDESQDVEAKIELDDLVGKLKTAIMRLPPFCKTFFMGLLEGKSNNDMREFFSSLNPRLKRSAFDNRSMRCRQRLIAELKKLSMWERGD